MRSRTITSFTLLAAGLLLARGVSAQGRLEDYRRAATIQDRLSGLTVDVAGAPNWLDGTTFWYSKTVKGGHAFVMVDATTQAKRPPFDHARLASGLSTATGQHYTETTLPFSTFEIVNGRSAIEADAGPSRWRCSLESYTCERIGEAQRRGRYGRPAGRSGFRREDLPDYVRSPDGKLEAFIFNYNVAVRPVARGGAAATSAFRSFRNGGLNGASDEPPRTDYRMLSYDGSEGDAYELRSIQWSPDSKKLVAYRRRPGYHRVVYFVLSSPADQLQPELDSMSYRKPGDVLDFIQPVLFDVASGGETVIDNALFPNAYQISSPEWRKDSHAFTFEYNQRGHQVYRVIEVNGQTGKTRAVIDEEVPTFFSYRTISGNARDTGKKFRYDIDEGREIIWMSERDGWNHLYLYDGTTGKVKNQITKGDWVVRNVDSVDVAHRQIYFEASGMNEGEDPYFVHYYRIDFNGKHLVSYTDAKADHRIYWSPDHAYYVDEYSRVDLPTVAELRRGSDGHALATLEKGDDSAELATGWTPPEVFVAKGRDGSTDIWGVIVKPTNFDPSKKYPVIENIYAGPQGSFVPKDWSAVSSMQSMAELGFIVVQIDGMGTNNRSKAFHDVAWKNLGDAGFPDRIRWHEAVAAKYPWYDITRVGITGTSAGGQNSTGGVLFHPEFYKVAVSNSGCHDNRMDKIWWNEHWMGWPIGPQYEKSSNVVNAWRLKGHLLLGVGEHDTNVDPSSTMQLVNALIQAGKDFQLSVQPNANHGIAGGEFNRLRDDFFVKWLLGVDPPDWNSGVTLVADADGQPIRFSADPLQPAPGFFEHPDVASPDAPWW